MSYFITVKMDTSDAVTKIQRWYKRLPKGLPKRLPECRHCGCKRLAYNYVCDECYHDKHRISVMPGM